MDNLNDNLEAVIAFLPGKVNSGSAESSPALTPDGTLYYSSFNSKREIIFDGDQGDYHAKIFSAESKDGGEYERPRPENDKINREGFNSGGVSFSRDGRTMYFTRAKLLNNQVSSSSIMISNKTDRGWGAPEILANLEGEFIYKHPFEGELFGRKVLYFSSNMDGGEGGFDIFYCDIDGVSIGQPVNLGNIVNTPEDEISPFYLDGTLYFSSNGHPNIGGFDIFYSNWNGSEWDVPSNMGFNYNTSYDDMFLRFNANGTQGFLVSNRPDKEKKKIKGNETCCDDIYAVNIKELVIDLAAKVEDENGPLKGATIELYDLTLGAYPDSKTGFESNAFNFALEADRDYKAYITKEGYYPDSISFNTNGILDDYSVTKTVVLKAKPKDDKSDVDVYTINEPIRLNNIYYDFDKSNILPDAEQDLEVLLDLLDEYSDMTIELSSHTDAQGGAQYNQRLSQRRAESAKTWLVNEGIEANRIKAVGYGESVILNRCLDGVKCSDEEHRLNRRTEFKILTGPTTIEIKKESLKKK
jgi:peptidoglycan-associated lipoprotein